MEIISQTKDIIEFTSNPGLVFHEIKLKEIEIESYASAHCLIDDGFGKYTLMGEFYNELEMTTPYSTALVKCPPYKIP